VRNGAWSGQEKVDTKGDEMKSDSEKLIQETVNQTMEKEIATVVCNPAFNIEVVFDESNNHLREEIAAHLERLRSDVFALATETFKTIAQISGSNRNIKFSFELNNKFEEEN
jgi:hypothetical protein